MLLEVSLENETAKPGTGLKEEEVDAPWVLIVDADPSARAIVAEELRDEGYWIAQAADGAQAFPMVTEGGCRPSLVLLGLRRHGGEEGQFARRVKQAGIAIPIVVLSGAPDAAEWAAAIAADGYLPQPLDLSDLLAVVERFCLKGGARVGQPTASDRPTGARLN